MIRSVAAWSSSTQLTPLLRRRFATVSKFNRKDVITRIGNDLFQDNEGRIVRPNNSRRPQNSTNAEGWDNFDAWDVDRAGRNSGYQAKPSNSNSRNAGNSRWDEGGDKDFRREKSFQPSRDNGIDPNRRNANRSSNNIKRREDSRPLREERNGGDRNSRRISSKPFDFRANDFGDKRKQIPVKEKEPDEMKTNMRALEGAGFVHLYGLASCFNALKADRRDFTRPEDIIDLDKLEGEELEYELKQRKRKPEAQYSPWLFVQDNQVHTTKRSGDKAKAADLIVELAKERKIPIASVDKGVLNTLSGNRPHQGYVLRCGKLEFESIPFLPTDEKKLWLCLDEVVDPQNLGALVRSAYFLSPNDIGIVVCSKNSAPPSPVVSAASAGALELAEIVQTSNLPKLLSRALEDGFRIIGASSSIPFGAEAIRYNLEDLPPSNNPTVLVLGSEGHGLRTLVANSCSEFVSIPGGSEDVDSLNVSVTGGILLWQLLRSQS
jgi:21S rRNA (GM2251-2'-O)-methyltransferase